MKTYIALFRAINVGGNNILPMKELRALLTRLGHQNVTSYIQSGNVIFQTEETGIADISTEISNTIEAEFGFSQWVLLLTLEQLDQSITANPFPDVENPSRLFLHFLAQRPANPDIKTLNQIKVESESFKLMDTVFYLHAPDGVGRSKLASRAEKLLGVAATARNWRTVQKLKAMANDAENH